MNLTPLLDGVSVVEQCCAHQTAVLSVSYDSRTLQYGALYVALPGYKSDGHQYIAQALDRGAVAVVCQRRPSYDGPWIVVEDSRLALAQISANWFGHPSRAMTMVGVTGTNGKTTTTYLLKQMLERTLHTKVGLIGTNQNMVGNEVYPAQRTTPESYELQKLLRQMVDSGCSHVVMEVSSHGLALHRVAGIQFQVGVFTNLTQEHLDFHSTMEAYRRAKGALFQQSDVAVFNLDDESGQYLNNHATCPTITYSENKDSANVVAKNIRLMSRRVEFEGVTMDAIARICLPIPGGFTIYNGLACIAAGLALGLTLQEMSGSLAQVEGIRGRIEVVPTPKDYTVVIDYAHTPNALENILTTARGFTENRLICLFGCGGDRDRSKRPVMGSIAQELADVVILTSDNPRTERPEVILEEILVGIDPSKVALVVEPDRRAAIALALASGQAGDVIILAGKGHETYQEIDGVRHHLDEREEIAQWLETATKY